MRVVREYGKPGKPHTSVVGNSTVAPRADLDLADSIELYQAHIAAFFAQGNFAQLEKEARDARSNQSRFKGGTWKLYEFYDAINAPSPTPESSTDSDWQAHISLMKKWVTAYPKSATARIALAQSYMNYGWAARGSGYTNTVSDSAWDLLSQRVDLAKATLLDAARLDEKCPAWYEAMQSIARIEGWPKSDARALFDEAVAFEPAYYHFYREQATTLLPKWRGEEGETQAFAEEVSTRLGEPDGSVIYFEIASVLACQCEGEMDSLAKMSWPRIKKGYNEQQRLYGPSNLKMNRFAYMSVLSGDKVSALETLNSLGNSWNQEVWPSAEGFEAAKRWASAP